MADITPGACIQIKIVKQPTPAATKTIARLLQSDPAVWDETKRQAKLRKVHFAPRRRGGRLYGGQLVKQHPIKGRIGESGTIRATPEVLRGLKGIAKFVEISNA